MAGADRHRTGARLTRRWTVAAFAAAPFKGNPACVVEPFDQWPSDGWTQAPAKENHQAETAFPPLRAVPVIERRLRV